MRMLIVDLLNVEFFFKLIRNEFDGISSRDSYVLHSLLMIFNFQKGILFVHLYLFINANIVIFLHTKGNNYHL